MLSQLEIVLGIAMIIPILASGITLTWILLDRKKKILIGYDFATNDIHVKKSKVKDGDAIWKGKGRSATTIPLAKCPAYSNGRVYTVDLRTGIPFHIDEPDQTPDLFHGKTDQLKRKSDTIERFINENQNLYSFLQQMTPFLVVVAIAILIFLSVVVWKIYETYGAV